MSIQRGDNNGRSLSRHSMCDVFVNRLMLRPKIIEYKKCQQEGLIEQERAETRLYNEWN